MVTGTFLRHIGKRESNWYWECDSRSRSDFHHIMFRFIAWQKECTLLRQEHELQAGPQPNTFKLLIRIRKITPVVLEFLTTIRTGRRPRAQE